MLTVDSPPSITSYIYIPILTSLNYFKPLVHTALDKRFAINKENIFSDG